MPIPRKKSCIHCRRAKARCSLATTCSRCADRGLQCSYAPFSRTISSVTRQDDPKLLGQQIIEQVPESHRFASDDSNETYAFNFGALEPLEFITDDLRWSNLNWGGPGPSYSVTGRITPNRFDDLFEKPSRPPSRPLSREIFSKNGRISPKQDFVPENDSFSVTIYGHVYHNLLAPSNPIGGQSLLTSRFIRGQLKAYPLLLLNGQLPPFIYPSCVLSDQLPQRCIMNGVHRCLPPPLAVCVSLIRIWEARTQATARMVWGSIYMEIKRLGDEHQKYDEDEMLGAFQALAIYMLLQAQDMQYMRQNDIVYLIMALMEIARSLSRTQSGSHLRSLFATPKLTHRLWAFNESLIRSMALMSIFESLLCEGIIGRRDPMSCGGSDGVPLPGSRYLWDYHSRESWAFRLEQARSSDGGLEPQMTLGHLRKAAEGDMASMDALARWCETTDEFGGLLRMSSLLG